jgi:hypothetical protein
LPSDQDIDLTPMVLVVRQTLVHLRARKFWEAVGDETVDCLAVLQQADNVMNPDPRPVNPRVTAARFWRPDNVTV